MNILPDTEPAGPQAMTIRRYFPAFFEGFEEETAAFSTIAELEAVSFVATWLENPEFHRLSLTKDNHLMCELKGGREWFVVGFIAGGRPDLPQPVFDIPTPQAVKLDDAYDVALLGASMSIHETDRFAYSISKLIRFERTRLKVSTAVAREILAKNLCDVQREHGVLAPVFINDELLDPVEDGDEITGPKILTPGSDGFQAPRRIR